MILNRLVVPEGNNIRFFVAHKEDGETYKLRDGETYYIKIKTPSPNGAVMHEAGQANNYFDLKNDFKYGTYPFEVGIQSRNGDRRIILPALDDRLQPLNELIILRRLDFDE